MAVVQVAFYKGGSRLFNRLVSWWTRGPYSHCELIVGHDALGRALCWSSSFMDGGVRQKAIELDPEHWDVMWLEVTDEALAKALDWFLQHQGQGYDVIGLIGFLWRPAADDKAKWFCSEALAAAMQFFEAWRFDPNTLHAALKRG